MKTLATLLFFSLTLPGSRFATPTPAPVTTAKVQQQPHKGGTWYFADSGHAVYCLGPVVMVPNVQGGLQRVATFCQGDKTMVPLKD